MLTIYYVRTAQSLPSQTITHNGAPGVGPSRHIAMRSQGPNVRGDAERGDGIDTARL